MLLGSEGCDLTTNILQWVGIVHDLVFADNLEGGKPLRMILFAERGELKQVVCVLFV